MRITLKKKRETRERICRVARNLFQEKGFERTTTRDIANEAAIATGTLFNYFPTKEALAMALVVGCLVEAQEEFDKQLQGDEALDERLFAHVAMTLRHLRPHRAYIGGVLESTMSPFAMSSHGEEPERVRLRHLETVRDLLTTNGAEESAGPSLVTMHLYWTLFLGVISYWTQDESPQQEDTLVLLDQAMKLFVGSLSADNAAITEITDGTARS